MICTFRPWPWRRVVLFDASLAYLVYKVERRFPAVHGPDRERSDALYYTPGGRFVLATNFDHDLEIRRLWRWQARGWLRRTDAPLATHQMYFP
jgi:hypothetical protein